MYTSNARSNSAGLDGDAAHLGWRLQILEVVGLVNKGVINTEFIEHQPVVFLILRQQVFQLLYACGLLLFDGFDDVAVGTPQPACSMSSASYSTICSRRNFS